MTVPQQQRKIIRPSIETRVPNAEHVTSVAIDFLKTLGNKHGVKPRKVSMQGQTYIVEMDIGKNKTATVQIEGQTREIKEYEIKTKEKEESTLNFPISPKTLIIVLGISALLYFIFEFLNVSSILFGR